MDPIVTDRDPMTAAMVGGKFARQRDMAAAGIIIPRFFCLTRAAFDEVVAPVREAVRARLAEIDFSRPESIRAAAADTRLLVAGADLPDWLERGVLARFDRLFGAGALVSVRASTVGHRLEESEDSATNPFAGMSESFLYVPRDEVLERVRACFASGLNEESILYRRAHGMDLFGFSVAVGIQRMVMGERSFVLFTCDPKTSARDVVIVAGYGIGEGVVKERVAVDHYFVNGRTGEIRREVVAKPERLTFDEARGRGLALRPVPPELRERPCLSDGEVRRLVEIGRRIEKLFRAPQDIEGTIPEGGEVHILQARPIAIDYRRQRVFTNANVTESFPGVTTALTYSFARFFYRVIFRDCYRRLGIPPETLDAAEEEWLDRMIAFLGGRVYYCLTAFYHLHAQSPLFPMFRAHWEKMMGFLSSYQTAPEGALDRVRAALDTARAAANLAWNYATHERELARFHAWWEGLVAPLRGRPFEDEDPLVLVSEFHRVWREVAGRWGVTLLNDTYLPLVYGLAEALFRRFGLDRDPSLLADLLCGDEELRSVEIICSAVRLAERVRASEALARAFAERGAGDLWRAIERGGGDGIDAAFAADVRRHLHDHGDRGLEELKMEQPNLRHTPERLVETIQRYARSDVTVEGFRARERAVRAAAEERLRAALGGGALAAARGRLLAVVLATLRRLIRNRENSRYCRSELFGFSKNVFRALGRHLVREGVLRAEDDVFHLTQDEIFGYIDGTGVTEDLQALADVRRREVEAHLAIETPVEITTLGPVRRNALGAPAAAPAAAAEGPPTAAAGDGRAGPGGALVLRGLGSSTGKARGRARVVLDPNAPLATDPDMILVARETDPGWLFLMLASKGIVVERGSMLSHTAITGRKFGIPTIVAVPDATRRIPDGAEVEIDGASGTVTILVAGGREPRASTAAASNV